MQSTELTIQTLPFYFMVIDCTYKYFTASLQESDLSGRFRICTQFAQFEFHQELPKITNASPDYLTIYHVLVHTQTARDPLASETERLAFDIIFYTLGRRTGRASDDIARCLRTSVDRMLDKHALVFNSMVGRLRVNRSSDLRQGFLDLSDELFQREEVRLRTASFLV